MGIKPGSLRLVVAIPSAVALLMVLTALPALGSETKHFTGQKNCDQPAVTVSPPNPGGYCLITQSSLKILRGAKVYYTAPVIAGGVLTSPITLRATDRRASTATGTCTYYFPAAFPPGHGLCVYTGGTGRLAGFHANVVVGPPIGGQRLYALTATYWFVRHDDDEGGE